MKNFLLLFIMGIFLNGCVETFAILGPASTLIGGGNVVQSSVTSAANYGIKKKTGKTPIEHAVSYAKENNPERKKEKCLDFIEIGKSEACTIAKKKVAEIKEKIKKKYKINNFNQ